MNTRRHVLQVLAAAPLAACAGGETLPDPVAGWRDPGAGETDPRRFALAHAILAPNPHNTQPWIVELDDADGMTLYCDLDRRLPVTDPLDRQITLGCGCFLELYRMAAAQSGVSPDITSFPEGEPTPRLDARPIAHVKLGAVVGQPYVEPTFTKIPERRTNRNVYEPRAPSEEVFETLSNIVVGMGEDYPGGVFWTTDPARVALGRDLVWRAFDREMRTAAAAEETFGWLRFGREEIARHRDGLAIEGPMIPLFKALGFLSREAMIDPDSQSNKQAAADWREKAMSSPAFLWLTSTEDTPSARLAAGRAYARLALAATEAGLALHPWSQALQEYEGMADLYAEMRTFLGAGPATVQMLVRIGYAEQVGPSARRDLNDLIRA
jgi:hypothetical protein